MKNWKTTLAGVLIGLIPILQTTLQTLKDGGTVDYYQILLGAGLMILGYLSKDYNVTGTAKAILLFVSLSILSNAQTTDYTFSAVPSAGANGTIQKAGFGGLLTSDSLLQKTDSLIKKISTADTNVLKYDLTYPKTGFVLAQVTDTNNAGVLAYNKETNLVGLFGKVNGKYYGINLDANGLSVYDTSNQITPIHYLLKSGTYLPTVDDGSNINTCTPDSANWFQTNNLVTVTGSFTLKVTDSIQLTEIDLLLPVATDFSLTSDLNGLGNRQGRYSNSNIATIQSNGTFNGAIIYIYADGEDKLHTNKWFYSYTYRVK